MVQWLEKTARNPLFWTILRDNSFRICGLEEMIKGQTVDRKSLNPKRGYGGRGVTRMEDYLLDTNRNSR